MVGYIGGEVEEGINPAMWLFRVTYMRWKIANNVPVWQQSPAAASPAAAAADGSEIPEWKLKMADRSHMDAGGHKLY